MQRILVAALVVGASLTFAGGDAFHAPTHDLAETPADVTVLGAASADTITFSPAVTTIALGTNLPAILEGNDTIDGSATGEVIQGAEARTFSCVLIFSAATTDRGTALPRRTPSQQAPL